MKNKLICLLEDDPDLRQVIKSVLGTYGYNVVGFGTAEEFRQQINLLHPALYMLDVNLPDGNGMDIAHGIRAFAGTAEIPVLMMSADPYQRGNDPSEPSWLFISKPFNTRDLLAAVRALT